MSINLNRFILPLNECAKLNAYREFLDWFKANYWNLFEGIRPGGAAGVSGRGGVCADSPDRPCQ